MGNRRPLWLGSRGGTGSRTQCRFLHTRQHYISWYFSLNDKRIITVYIDTETELLKWFLRLMVLLIPTKVSPDFEDVVNDELHEYYGLEWSKHHRFTMIKLFNYMKVTSDTATESWAWLPQHQRRSPHVWFTYSIWAGQIAMEIKMTYVTTGSHEVCEFITDLQTHMDS